eukprot:scaffold5061_cov378-Prasinococcus_capsulatus_cf.AAC.2
MIAMPVSYRESPIVLCAPPKWALLGAPYQSGAQVRVSPGQRAEDAALQSYSSESIARCLRTSPEPGTSPVRVSVGSLGVAGKEEREPDPCLHSVGGARASGNGSLQLRRRPRGPPKPASSPPQNSWLSAAQPRRRYPGASDRLLAMSTTLPVQR